VHDLDFARLVARADLGRQRASTQRSVHRRRYVLVDGESVGGGKLTICSSASVR
jgi:hypothetical protein